MYRILTGIGLVAAGVLIAASATMNYLFMSSLGKTWLEGQVLGAVSVAADVLKAIVVVLVAAAARDGRRVFVVVGSLAFVLFSIASLVAATGFAAQNRSAVTDGRLTAKAELERAERELADTERRLAQLPPHRPKSIIEAALAGHEIDPRWRSAGGCRQTVTPSLRAFCRTVSDRREELASALEAGRLEIELQRLRARLAELAGRGANRVADPQARLLAEALGFDEGTVQRLLMALLALVVEVASGLGLYLAMGHGRASAVPEPGTSEPPSAAASRSVAPGPAPEASMPSPETSPAALPSPTGMVTETMAAAPRPRRPRGSIAIVAGKPPGDGAAR